MAITENTDPKHPTTKFGWLFIIISAAMYVIKYLVAPFIEFKQELLYDNYGPLFPLGIGILLIFINQDYFERIFNRVDKAAAKKTDTE